MNGIPSSISSSLMHPLCVALFDEEFRGRLERENFLFPISAGIELFLHEKFLSSKHSLIFYSVVELYIIIIYVVRTENKLTASKLDVPRFVLTGAVSHDVYKKE
jgi:hypothetical protein